MAVVLISSLYEGGRDQLAEALARKTNWPVLSREEAQEKARKAGIKVGRLEIAVMKNPALSNKLMRERDLYLAFITATVCEKARTGDLIYTGRSGHLMLPGISHRLRVGLTVPFDVRIRRAAKALKLPMEKAEPLLEKLDEDMERWIRWAHQVDDGRNPNYFDAFFNLENVTLSNAAAIVCTMADLPDFQATPVSKKRFSDLDLASRAKVRLALSEKTHDADLNVHADNGVLTVTYPPHQDYVSADISRVLAHLEGCRGIQCTMAETNILWVQEHFETESENFQQIMQLARRWGAAVELLRPVPSGTYPCCSKAAQIPQKEDETFREMREAANDGGIEDDEPVQVADDGGLVQTEEELIKAGRYGGKYTVCGGYDNVLDTFRGKGKYSLVVIGDMFLSKGSSTRTRRTRELAMSIRDRLKAPVITADELKSRFLFGRRQALALAGFLAVTVAVYFWIFSNQKTVLDFLSGKSTQHSRFFIAAVVALFVPSVAYVYGKVTELMLKIFNID